MKKTNFDRYLDEQMHDPAFAARYKNAGAAWDVALQITALREQAGFSQKELARHLKTSQQQISRLESPGYEGHSLATLRRSRKCCMRGCELFSSLTIKQAVSAPRSPARPIV